MKPVNMGVLGEKSKAIQKIPLKISPYYMVKYWILKDKNDKYSHLLIKPEPYELYEINGVTI